MKHLEQMTWKERIGYAIEKGDDLTLAECKWLEGEADKWLRKNRLLEDVSKDVFDSVRWRKWQKASIALERLED